MNFNFPIYKIPDSKIQVPVGSDLGNPKLIVLRASDDYSTSIEEMFQNILKAARIDITSDLKLITTEQKQAVESSSWLNEELNSTILVFGLKPKDIGLQIKHIPYHPVTMNNCSLVFAHSLTAIHLDKSLKMKLWNVLKLAFKL